MPAPQASILQNLAKNNFRAKNITLPVNWQQPSGEKGEMYSRAFKDNEKNAPSNPTLLFKSASSNKYHVDTTKNMSDKFEKYIDGICSAICSAWSQWQSAATITGVIINGPVGIMPPGGLVGLPLFPLIMATAPKSTPQEAKYSNAIANAVSTSWQAWQSGLSIPALPYPPTFATCPSPVHPPTPNITFPLAGATSAGETMLSGACLKNLMVSNLADPSAQHHQELFDSIANAFHSVFMTWKSSTMINNVLGTGPVPTFAPPFVPVGPVVCGVGNGPPGCVT